MSSDCHSFRIIYENEDLVIVNKPHDVPMDGEEYPITVEKWALSHLANASNMTTTTTTTNKNENTSLNAKSKQMDGKKRVKFVHQLDYATSGVLCVAFSREMAARLSHCFEMRTTQKAYLAILRGIIPPLNKESSCGINSNSNSDGKCISTGVECYIESTYSNAVRIVTLDELPNADFIQRCINDAAISNSNKENSNNNEEIHTDELSSSSSSFLIAIDLPVGYDDSDPGGFRMSVNGRDARESLTYMYVLQRGYMQHPTEKTTIPVTKVILIPRTGRRHQLRVHCHALGFPILGDVTYDAIASPQIVVKKTAAEEGKEEMNGNNVTIHANIWERMMLHAWRLSFPESVELLRCGMERYMQKRKRRRVRLGLEAPISSETPVEWTHFKTEDPFTDYISESSPF